ncbi:MAG: tetratricopeptide repeat protein [Chloroflexi bacterium]|nr:tetratricopeptide repeat protein [Chloroflexota bacterium]
MIGLERNTATNYTPSVYIPMDRRQALARGESLPDRTSGAALFADISGFTPLTEALARTLGPRLGAEELTHQLNRVYDALIAEVDQYGGSVIGFAGDAITCWFADDGAPLRATACALAMQKAMEQFSVVELASGETVALAMKAAVASGPARRFLVGDPSIQLVDALAGETLSRMADAEHLANRGEVVVDAQTVVHLGERGHLVEWRTEAETGARFAVVDELTTPVEPTPWPLLSPQALPEIQVRSWLLPVVYGWLRDGLGEFLEFKHGVTLFLRFEGIDYEGDEVAGTKLDDYIRWVQGVLTQYEGSLLQLIIGDKGSYLYAAFGAPIAHEDDARRAAMAALDLRSPPVDLHFIQPVQIGISQGTVRAGTYGGTTRRTYGVLSDEVNLAARLMQNAAPGEVLVSQRVRETVADIFVWDPLSSIRVKGKSESISVARLVGMSETQTEAGVTAHTGLLIGRETEMAQLVQFLQPIFEDGAGFAGVAYVYGEAGVGKSRLIYELRQHFLLPSPWEEEGTERGVSWFTCPAEQILRQSLYPFKHFQRGYFEQYADSSPEENKERFNEILNTLISDLKGKPDLAEVVQELERTRSFLGALVGLHWEGALYEQLEPKLRFENTLAAFKTLIMAESRRQPVVLHIEDAQWLDADSYELLQVLVRNVGAYPFAVLITGRYGDDGSRFSVEMDSSVPRQIIDLNVLPPLGIRALAEQTLEGAIADDLAAFLAEKTNGNPLFVEQLAMDMRERGMIQLEADEQHLGGVWRVVGEGAEEVPVSISAVLIARLDRLAARIKAAVQTAAVLGNEFEVQILSLMLWGDTQLARRIKQAEEEMIWSSLSELRYIFRHTLMRDAAYIMQLQTHLQELHALAAEAVEQVYAADLGFHYADLAYHWGKAGNIRQEFRYAKLAGEHAVGQFANQEAVDHFHHALESATGLPLEETVEQQRAIHIAMGELLTTTGQYEHAQEHLDQALSLATERGNQDGQARACRLIARAYELRGEYSPALEWIQRGLDALEGRETAEVAELSLIAGMINTRQGNYDDAMTQCQSAMQLAQKLQEVTALARAYNLLGHITRLRGNSTQAIEHFRQSLDLYRQADHIHGEATTHNLIAYACLYTGQLRDGERHGRLARKIFDQIGDIYNRAFVDNNLGEILLKRGDLDGALTSYREALRVLEQIGGSSYVLGALHNNLGATFIRRREIAKARHHLDTALDYFEQAQARDFLPELHCHIAHAALLAGELSEAEEKGGRALDLARELEMRGEEGKALRVLGEAAATRDQLEQAQDYLEESVSLLHKVGDEYEEARSKLSLARVYAVQENPEAEQTMLDYCIEVFQRLGAALDLKAAQSLQEKLGDSLS